MNIKADGLGCGQVFGQLRCPGNRRDVKESLDLYSEAAGANRSFVEFD